MVSLNFPIENKDSAQESLEYLHNIEIMYAKLQLFSLTLDAKNAWKGRGC